MHEVVLCLIRSRRRGTPHCHPRGMTHVEMRIQTDGRPRQQNNLSAPRRSQCLPLAPSPARSGDQTEEGRKAATHPGITQHPQDVLVKARLDERRDVHRARRSLSGPVHMVVIPRAPPRARRRPRVRVRTELRDPCGQGGAACAPSRSRSGPLLPLPLFSLPLRQFPLAHQDSISPAPAPRSHVDAGSLCVP